MRNGHDHFWMRCLLLIHEACGPFPWTVRTVHAGISDPGRRSPMNGLIRLLLVPVALVTFLPASAAEPEQAVVKPAAAATPTTPAALVAPSAQTAKPADAAAATPSDGRETAVARVPNGYKVKKIGGEIVYCRKSTPLGSRFPTEVCMTVAQYEESVRQRDGLRQELTGKQKSYYIPPEPGRGG